MQEQKFIRAVVSYRFSRLCFKAAFIEPIRLNAAFAVITPDGTFCMTKADFYEHFPNVVSSVSYRKKGIYHYPRTPRRALRFLASE